MLNDKPLSKRVLGRLLMAAAMLAALGTVAVDWFGAGQDGGFGPTQRAGLLLALGVFLFGASLIPLGDRPA